MILVDTSAWVEFLRDTGSTTYDRVEALLGGEIAVCDAILMEVLAGARDERHLHDLRRLLARATVLPMEPRHHEEAAALFRLCRREGETVRKLIDCLIGALREAADPARAPRQQAYMKSDMPCFGVGARSNNQLIFISRISLPGQSGPAYHSLFDTGVLPDGSRVPAPVSPRRAGPCRRRGSAAGRSPRRSSAPHAAARRASGG